MASSVTTYRGSLDDAGDLATLRFEWRTGERGEVGLSMEEFAEHFSEWFAEHASSHTAFLAAEDGRAIGCGWLVVVDRVPGPGYFTRRAGMIQSLYVAVERRNQGVGAVLVQRIIDEARSRGMDYLTVHPSHRSFEFYRRLGFDGARRALELDLDGRRG